MTAIFTVFQISYDCIIHYMSHNEVHEDEHWDTNITIKNKKYGFWVDISTIIKIMTDYKTKNVHMRLILR